MVWDMNGKKTMQNDKVLMQSLVWSSVTLFGSITLLCGIAGSPHDIPWYFPHSY